MLINQPWPRIKNRIYRLTRNPSQVPHLRTGALARIVGYNKQERLHESANQYKHLCMGSNFRVYLDYATYFLIFR